MWFIYEPERELTSHFTTVLITIRNKGVYVGVVDYNFVNLYIKKYFLQVILILLACMSLALWILCFSSFLLFFTRLLRQGLTFIEQKINFTSSGSRLQLILFIYLSLFCDYFF